MFECCKVDWFFFGRRMMTSHCNVKKHEKEKQLKVPSLQDFTEAGQISICRNQKYSEIWNYIKLHDSQHINFTIHRFHRKNFFFVPLMYVDLLWGHFVEEFCSIGACEPVGWRAGKPRAFSDTPSCKFHAPGHPGWYTSDGGRKYQKKQKWTST